MYLETPVPRQEPPEPKAEHSLGEFYNDKSRYLPWQVTRLIPRSYAMHHPDAPSASKDVFTQEWLNDRQGPSPARLVDEYISKHLDDPFDPEDDSSIEALLRAALPELSAAEPDQLETVH